MQVFDTSSLIYAWDNYPIDQFPGLWEWMAARVQQGVIRLPQVAVEEVGHKTQECLQWLNQANHQTLPITEAILIEAARIKQKLEIGEKYGAGVDENDLLIIATAKMHGVELVTNEDLQLTPNKKKQNWKIPAVCNMPSVQVPCTTYLNYLKRSQAVFG